MEVKGWKKQFFIIWSGQAVSILTSAIIQMAVIWYLTDKTKSAAVLSMATLIAFLPQALIGSFAGVFIDRYNRKTIMMLSDGFIALLGVFLMISGFLGEIPVWFIMAILFGRSVGAAFHNPSLQAITPMLVPKEELTKYAGYSGSIESISYLISPALAAVLYSMFKLHLIVILDVLGALVAIFMLMLVKVPDTVTEPDKRGEGYFGELKAGMSILSKEKGMITLMIISGLYAIVYFPIGNLYPLITMTYFRGTFVESSVIEIVFSLGSLVGSFVLGMVGSNIHKGKSIGRSIGVYGIGLLIIGLLPRNGFLVFAVVSALMGASVPFFTGIQTSIYQMNFKAEFLGRVLSLTSSFTMMAMPVGLILSGLFAERIGVERWFFLSGIGTCILFLFARRAMKNI